MKTFKQLTKNQQKEAIQKILEQDLKAILEGELRFNDALNQDDLQKRIDSAIEKAEKMQTPWFAHEYILDTCREDLEGMAQCTAEDALYSEPSEYIINGIIKK